MVWYLEKSGVKVMSLCDASGCRRDCRDFIILCASVRLSSDGPGSNELPFEYTTDPKTYHD
jgi:hypothetical protein